MLSIATSISSYLNRSMQTVHFGIYLSNEVNSTHWGRLTHICVSKTHKHWFRQWLVVWPAPSHYLNQCWNIGNLTPGNKLQQNLNENLYIFTQANGFENGVRKIMVLLSRPQCVKNDNSLDISILLTSWRVYRTKYQMPKMKKQHRVLPAIT